MPARSAPVRRQHTATQRHITRRADTPRHTAHGIRHTPLARHIRRHTPRATSAATTARLHQHKACAMAREHNHLPVRPTTRRGRRAVVYEQSSYHTPGAFSVSARGRTQASASAKTRDCQ